MNRGRLHTPGSRPRETLRRILLIVAVTFAIGAFTPPIASAQDETGDTDQTQAPSGGETPGGESSGGPSVSTTLAVDGIPVVGVELVVSLDGEEIGRASTDATGVARVALPGAGKYDITLDPNTFPEGIDFAADAPTELAPNIRATGDRSVIFRLAAGDSPSDSSDAGTGSGTGSGSNNAGSSSGSSSSSNSTMARVLNLLVSGTRFGLVIALGAVGLSIIFGTTGLTNFAHGEMMVFGAVAAWYLNATVGGLGLPLLLAGLIAVGLSALFGLGFELGVYRPLRKRNMPVVSQMVVSIGLAFACRYLFSVIFGSSAKQYSQYAAQSPSIELGPLALRPKDLVISIIALVALIGVGLFLRNSRMGTAIRAVSDNRDLAVASGIDDLKVVAVVWAMAGGLAGLGGVMLGSSESVTFLMGQRVLLVMFAAVLLGGLGTAFGAIVGGLFVGIVSDLSTLWLDADLKIIVALGTLVVVLLTRPQGVFGVKARAA